MGSTKLKQRMYALLERQRDSGLSKKAFCRQHQLKPATFYYWQHKYEQEQHQAQPTTQQGFIALQVQPSYCYTVQVAGGQPIQLASDNLAAIAALLVKMSRLSDA